MDTLNTKDPSQFIANFFTSFSKDLLSTEADPALIVDRYHTSDIIQVADGHRMDRDRLIEHARPVRKNRPSSWIDVHEAIADGDRIAARYTLHVKQRGRDFAIEVCFFGEFAGDGRMRNSHMLTRMIPGDSRSQQSTSSIPS